MKKLLSILVFAVLAVAISVTAFAADSDVVASGYCGGEGDGTNLTWTLTEDGTLTISGEGKMADYTWSGSKTTAPWGKYTSNLEKLVIEEGITTIGNDAFFQCTMFSGNLIIPNSVITIGSDAFYNCNFDGNLIIPNSVMSIGDHAFHFCDNFAKTIKLQDNICNIGYGAFYQCTIDEYYFDGDAPSLKGLYTFPSFDVDFDTIYYPANNNTWIVEDGKWNGYTAVPYNPNIIASGYCGGEGDGTNLTWTLTEDGTLTISGEGAMKNYFSNYINGKIITSAPWGEYSDSLRTLIIEEGVTTIGNSAFYYCFGFTGSLTIPDSVTTIEKYAFDGCSGFTGNLVIPDSVTTIGERAFYYCTGFTGSLTIPDSVTTIGDFAFYDCGCVDYCFVGDAPSIGSSIINNGREIYYPAGNNTWKIENGKWNGYPAAEWDPELPVLSGYCGGEGDGTNLRWEIDKEGTLTISGKGKMANYASEFENGRYITTAPWGDYRYRLKSVEIGEEVSNIGDYAFYGCHDFEGDLVIPDGIIIIGIDAFYNCDGFDGNLIIGSSVISIGDSAFDYCSGFTGDLVIPNSVTTIGDSAFYYCSGFTGNLVIGNGVTTIGNSAFSSCSGFTGSLTIPDSVTTIGNYAFYDCDGFTGNLVIGDSVTTIGYNAFDGCSGFLGDLVIPNSVTGIASSAFYNCSGFDGNLILGCSLNYIGESAFYNCSGFKGSLIVPDSVIEIGSDAFYYCTGFDGNLEIGSNVRYIYAKAFYNCTGFTGSVVFPEKIYEIGSGAFYYCGAQEYYFKGNAPSVYNVSSGDRSFDFDDTIYYPFGNSTWNVTNGKWNGYTAKDWAAKTEAFLNVSSGTAAIGRTKKVTVDVSEYSGIAMMQFTLKYDPSVLEIVSCSAGSLAEGATMNCENEGQIRFAWESLSTINGPGTVLEVEFKVLEDANPQKTVVGIDKGEKFIFKRADKTDIAMGATDGIINIVEIIYGDINGDGSVDVVDAFCARLIAAKLETPDEIQKYAGDVDGDGRITAVDANYIRKYTVKLISVFPVEQQ